MCSYHCADSFVCWSFRACLVRFANPHQKFYKMYRSQRVEKKIGSIKNTSFYPRDEIMNYPLKLLVDNFQFVSWKQQWQWGLIWNNILLYIQYVWQCMYSNYNESIYYKMMRWGKKLIALLSKTGICCTEKLIPLY